MYRYLYIESKKDIRNNEAMIVSLFSEFIEFTKKDIDNHSITLFYNREIDISLYDIILNIMSDTLSDLRLYASFQFESQKEMKDHLEFLKKRLHLIPFTKYVYLDDKAILKEFIFSVDDELIKFTLRKYTNDQLMIQSVKTYLESNQNTSVASKKLYVHRNTLLQRLDKFMNVTGFDVRLFLDAYLIYHLLK